MARKTENIPAKSIPGGKPKRQPKGKEKTRQRRRALKLKGWLKTPADWARFDAWAKINAQPRKIQEPEIIVRPSKPLSQLKKGIQTLSQPRKQYDSSIHCRLDLSISKAALKAKCSRRIIKLAWPIIRIPDYGRAFPVKIPPSALNYVASSRIVEISQPRVFITEECKPYEVSKEALKHKTTEREKKIALAKKLVECPEMLTAEEREVLFTPRGIRKSALTYECSPWMILLSLPAYKSLKDRTDENAEAWKKQFLEESETRGKQALKEQKQKPKALKEKEKLIAKEMSDETHEDKDESLTRDEGGNEDEIQGTTETENAQEIIDSKKGTETTTNQKKIGKHAWRFEPPPCKDNPFAVSKAAVEGQISTRVEFLAVAREYQNLTTRDNPFCVKKSALTATPSGRVEILAKPLQPKDLIEKKQPREKNKYGMPVFEKPVYEKILPKTKPYKMGEWKPVKKDEAEKRKPINPIIYYPTYDPCIHPRLAKIQMRERKKAESVLNKLNMKRKHQREQQNVNKKETANPKKGTEDSVEEQAINKEQHKDDEKIVNEEPKSGELDVTDAN